eukprot:136249-Pleurochrysis_carterae.AAC.1
MLSRTAQTARRARWLQRGQCVRAWRMARLLRKCTRICEARCPRCTEQRACVCVLAHSRAL